MRGLILTDFSSMRQSQQLLLSFARHFAHDLVIAINKKDCPRQIKQHLGLTHENIRRDSALSTMAFDYVFSDDNAHSQYAQLFGAKFMPFDTKGEISDACKLQPITQASVYRICLFGAESTGKTTLSRALAQHFSTVWVPEYARELHESRGAVLEEDVIDVAHAQWAMEKTITPYAKRFLFCDTNPLLTSLWSEWLFGNSPTALVNLISQLTYDHYLLTDIDLVWQPDPARCLQGEREAFAKACLARLQNHHCQFTPITGKGRARTLKAIALLDKYYPIC